MVYWPQDWVSELNKAGDTGPVKVVYGSIHSRMPTISSIQVGDVVFPVSLIKKKLYVMARMPVTHRERAIDYCMRELGRPCGALRAEDDGYPTFEYTDSWQPVLPHLKHQKPFNCCSKWAVWGEDGTDIRPARCRTRCCPSCASAPRKAKKRACALTKTGM